MNLHRILFFGAPGQIGQAFQHVWNNAAQRPLWEIAWMGREDCDVTDASQVRDVIQNYRPHLLINAAALTNVDLAERDEKEATAVNFHAAASMAAQCSALDIPMIQFSTDYVFDGTKDTPYLPDDQMNPINAYGASKMMGEEAVRHELAWHVILRVSSVFSAFRRNLLTNAIQLFGERDEIRMVTDMVCNPTPATHIAEALLRIGEQLLGGKTDGFGTFHLSGAPACSRYELTEAFLASYKKYSSRTPKLVPTVRAEFPAAAKRPAYSALDCEKIKRLYGVDQRPWQEGLDEAMAILFKGGRTRL